VGVVVVIVANPLAEGAAAAIFLKPEKSDDQW